MNYRIGSFNIQKFGESSHKDFAKIAEIIYEEQLDVVALQEIFSEGKGVMRMLEERVKYELYGWKFCWDIPRESHDIEKMQEMIKEGGRGEGYGYLWNTKRLKKVEFSKLGEKKIFEPRILNSLGRDVNADLSFYKRTPYYIRLQPVYGGMFEFRLINVHLFHGGNNSSSMVDKRKIEHQVLAEIIYPEIGTRTYGNHRTPYTIAMGDYNLNIYRPLRKTNDNIGYLTEVFEVDYKSGKAEVKTIQTDLSTVRTKEKEDVLPIDQVYKFHRFANNYDHFTYSQQISDFKSIKANVINVVDKYCGGDLEYYTTNISDHMPIVLDIEI